MLLLFLINPTINVYHPSIKEEATLGLECITVAVLQQRNQADGGGAE